MSRHDMARQNDTTRCWSCRFFVFLGEILVNGGELTKRYKRISALVTQDDALQTSLTVRGTNTNNNNDR